MATQSNILELISQTVPEAVGAVNALEIGAKANAAKSEELAGKIAARYGQVAVDTGIITDQAQRANLGVQTAIRTAVDVSGGVERQLGIISQLVAAEDRLKSVLPAIRAENQAATGFSPIEWIKQIFDVSGVRTEANDAINEINALSATSRQIEQNIGVAGNIAKASAEANTVATVEAATRNAAAEAEIRALQAAELGFKHNTLGLQAAKEASSDRLAIYYNARAGEIHEAQFALSQQEAARRARMDAIQERALLAREQATKDDQLLDEMSMKYISLGEAARGLPQSSALEIKNQLRLLKNGDQSIKELYDVGRLSEIRGMPVVGIDPAQTARALAKNPQMMTKLPEARRRGLELVAEVMQEMAGKRDDTANLTDGAALRDDKTGKAEAAYINSGVQRKVAEYLSNVGNNLDNPFHIGSLNTVLLDSDPKLSMRMSTIPLVTEVLLPMAKAGNQLSDPTAVIKLSVGAALQGKIPLNQAANNLVEVYRTANVMKRAELALEGLGISIPKNGAAYRVRIGGELVDMTDHTQVLRAMNKEAASQIVLDQPYQGMASQRPAIPR